MLPASLLLANAPTASASTSQQFTQPCGNVGTPGQVKHVIWIWMENESYSSVIGNSNAPYQTSLAQQCGNATNFYNESHGSLNNYIAATSGMDVLNTSFVNDCLPNPGAGYCVSSGSSIFSQLDGVGMSWRDYNEDMPANCSQTDSGNYVVRHNPAAYYSTLSTCAQFDVPMGSLSTQTGAFYTAVNSGDLPSFSFIAPNMIDDAHAGTSAGDTWLSEVIPFITSGPNYQAGNTVIFITNDEGCGGSCGPDYAVNEDCSSEVLAPSQPSCHIPTIIIAPYEPSGTVDGTFYTHYSMLRSTEELLGLPLLGLAGSANSMTDAFNLGPISDQYPPPSAPGNLSAANGPTGVDLTWSASTAGSVPVTGYDVMRDGVLVGSVTGTSYTDTSVSAGQTYTYDVVAFDAAGNDSAPSGSVSVTVPTVVNLLANPGFESWSGGLPAGWSTYGPATTLTQTSDAHSGSSAVAVTTTSTKYTSAGVVDGSKPTVSSTTAGVTYAASCWVRASKLITVNVKLHEVTQHWASVASPVVSSLKLPDTTNWHQISVSYTAAASGDMLPMSAYSTNMVSGGAVLEIDDCALTAG